MRVSTAIGLVVGFGSLLLSVVLEKGELSAFINVPAAFVVFGGTMGATLMSFPAATVRQLPSLIRQAFAGEDLDFHSVAATMVRLSERARREGLLALEDELDSIRNPLLRRGTLLVIDGTDPELVRGVIESDMAVRHRERDGGAGLLEAMGGFAPTMGIIGTVMGLVHVLGSMSDPSRLAGAIAVAFIATFYGVGSANLLWLPLASKLRKQAEAEQLLEEMILEGLASIQSGENPRILQERLDPYLPKAREPKRSQEQLTHGEHATSQERLEPGQA